jgi:lipoprotein-releasing system ATP-binding protein
MILRLHDIHKKFGDVAVLKGVSFEVSAGEIVAITGKSGEGKSTLLHIIGTLEKLDKGTLEICGKFPEDSLLHTLRNENIGFIFQTYNLLEEYTVLENLLMPQKIARKNCGKNSINYQRAQELLEEVQLSSKGNTLAKFLSGGEKQRVAIARALSNDPSLILADEPTGNLDNENSKRVQELLIQTAKKRNKTVLIATHDQELAKECDRTLLLKDGRIC